MKTRIATIILLCLFGMTTVMASQPVPASKAVRASVVDLVKKNMKYPEFAIDDKTQCCVVLSMVIQDDGTLKVDQSNSVSPQMQNYVVKTVETLKDEKLARHSGERVLMKVTFELIS
jgi:hypothetical protein